MKIHFLSDLHLETGHFAIPADLEYDVLVVSGDIANNFTDAMSLFNALNKPVVCVFGNHDYWSDGKIDFQEKFNVAKAMTAGTKVHLLNNETVVINGVRFIGATLWSNFGKMTSALVDAASYRLRDYGQIYASSWFKNDKNLATYRKFYQKETYSDDAVNELINKEMFDPVIANNLFNESVKFLRKELNKYFNGETVVVTHHAPTMQALKEFGVSEHMLDKKNWDNAHYKSDHAYRVAGYASDLDDLLEEFRDKINVWSFGHLHKKMDFIHKGIRFVCNPRGYHQKPFSERDKTSFALFGYPITDDDIKKSQENYQKDPYRGDVFDFEDRFVINSSADLPTKLKENIEFVIEDLSPLKEEMNQFAQEFKGSNFMQKKALQESFMTRFEECRSKLREVTVWALGQLEKNEKMYSQSLHMDFMKYDLFSLSENILYRFEHSKMPLKQAKDMLNELAKCEKKLLALPFIVNKERAVLVNILKEIKKELNVKKISVSGWVVEPWNNNLLNSYYHSYVFVASDEDFAVAREVLNRHRNFNIVLKSEKDNNLHWVDF